MNAFTESLPNPYGDGKFRIAHLSDIHFGAHFDLPLWGYVQQLLRKDPPNLILITGDIVDSPSLVYLLLARRQLESLAEMYSKSRSKSAFRIIPGNHDIAIFGNVKIWPMTYFFDWIFYDIDSEEIKDFPTYIKYMESGVLERTRTYLKICRFAFRRICKTPKFFFQRRSRPVIRENDPDEVFIVYLDSNFGMRLATGRVSEFQVAALKGAVMDLSLNDDGIIRSFVPRIALLHHHAMPIPYSDGNEGLTSFEPFLMLRNAGTLLRELCLQDFDLVLHGHKHYSSYCRISFSKPDEPDGDLTVIAAGSCGVGLPEEGRNSINLIDISQNGQIMIEKCLFGNGESPDTSNRKAYFRQRFVFDIPSLKRRAYRRALEVQGREADLLYREVRINETGTPTGEIYFDNFRLIGKGTVKHREIRLSTDDIGSLIPELVNADEGSKTSGLKFQAFHPMEGDDKTPNEHAVVCRFDFEHVMTSQNCGVHYGIRYTSHNSFRISDWEGRMLSKEGYQVRSEKSSPSTESIYVAVRYPCRKLIMKLVLPGNLCESNVRVYARKPKSYPLLKLVDGDIKHEREELVNDPDITSFELRNFRKQEKSEKSDECYILEIDYPLVGYDYKIEWNIRNIEEATANSFDIGRAEAIRKQFLESSAEGLITRIMSLIKVVQSEVKKNFGSKLCPSETIAVCLHVLDTEKKVLTLIAEAPGSDGFRSHCSTLPWARGVRGTAAKMRRLIFYIDSRLRSGRFKGTKLHSPSERTLETHPRDYSILIAYPIMLARKRPIGPERRPPPQELIGVLSIGSNAMDSGLIQLIFDKNIEIDELSEHHEASKKVQYSIRNYVLWVENALSLNVQNLDL